MARPALRQTLLAAAFYAAATVVFTWPIAAHVRDGLGDLWDAKLNAWIFQWDFHQTFRDPVHLFDANIFYPARYALAFSENLYGAAVFGFPLCAAGASPLTVYNVLFLLGMFLSALAAWALARYVTRDALCSLMAGVVYAYVPWRLAQIPHAQFQWGPFLPLLVLFLLRYLDGGRRRDAALLGVSFAWNALANVHYAVFSGFLVAAVLGYRLLADGAPSLGRAARAMGVFAIAGAMLVPFFLPYAWASKLYGMERGDEEIRGFSGRPIDLLTAGPQNKLYGPITQKLAQPEGDFFPGLAVTALAAAAIALRRRSTKAASIASPEPRSGRRGWIRALDSIVAVLAVVWLSAKLRPGLVLGPLHLGDPGRVLFFLTVFAVARLSIAFPRRSRYANLSGFVRRGPFDRDTGLFLLVAATGLLVAFGMHTPYYRFLVQSFGAVFRSIRVPSRGIVLFDLGIGVLAAMGLCAWAARLSHRLRPLALAAALAITTIEYRAFPVSVSPVDPAPAPAEEWLASLPAGTPVVEWPIGPWPDMDHEFRSTAHWQPLINGFSGFAPRPYDELVALTNRRPQAPEVWDRMRELGARILIFHPHQVADDAQLAYIRGALAGIDSGRAIPLRMFDHGADKDLALGIGGAHPVRGAEADPAVAPEVRKELLRAAVVADRPFGFIDSPKEDEVVSAGQWGFGWALDDSGIAAVGVSSDGGPESPATFGGPHPGVAPVYPGYPDTSRPGFGFAIPPLPSGSHVLTVIIHAKDGGRAELRRHVRVR